MIFEACTTTSLQVSSYRKISIYINLWPPHVFFGGGGFRPNWRNLSFNFHLPNQSSQLYDWQAEGPRISPRDPARRKEEGQLLAVWPPIRQRGSSTPPVLDCEKYMNRKPLSISICIDIFSDMFVEYIQTTIGSTQMLLYPVYRSTSLMCIYTERIYTYPPGNWHIPI